MIDLRVYLPAIYAGVLEMEALMDTENFAFNELFDIIEDAQNDQYVLTATERGLQAFEQLFGIIASPGDTTEFRRERLINRLIKNQAYTLKALRERFDNILTIGSYSISVDYDDYTIYIIVATGTYGKIKEIKNTIVEMLPANMHYDLQNNLMAVSVARLMPAAITTIGVTYTLY